MGASKGCTAVNEFVEEDSKCPNVESVVMWLVHYHLWSHILKRTTVSIPGLLNFSLHTPSKVADLDDIILLDQNVLWLDISVDQSLLVHVVNATADLNEEVKRHIFLETLFLSDQIEQIAFVAILQGQVNGFFVFEAGVKAADVVVVQLLLNTYFSRNCFLNFSVHQCRFLYSFDCDWNSKQPVYRFLDLAI